jgi:hypothetical protein
MNCYCSTFVAGRSTTNDELEDMLESGNPAIFTQGVGDFNYSFIKIGSSFFFINSS